MTRMMIKLPGQEKPAKAFPTIGRWYSGMSDRGRGAVAQFQGWGQFTLGDGTEIDMTAYEWLEEHEPRPDKT